MWPVNISSKCKTAFFVLFLFAKKIIPAKDGLLRA